MKYAFVIYCHVKCCFIDYLRINKECFFLILDKIGPHSKSSDMPMSIQLAATIRFFAESGFQRSVGNNVFIAIHRTTFSKVFAEKLTIFEQILCQHWIKVPFEPQDFLKSKKLFFE